MLHRWSALSRLLGTALIFSILPAGSFAAETAEDQSAIVELPVPGPDEIKLHFHQFYKEQIAIRPKSSLEAIQRDALQTTETLGRAIAKALVDGPTEEEKAKGYQAFLPPGAKLDKVDISGNAIQIYIELPAAFVKSDAYNNKFVEEAGEHFIESLRDYGYREFSFYVKDPDDGTYKPIRYFLNEQDLETAPSSKDVTPQAASEPGAEVPITPESLPTQNGFVAGGLSGKSIVLNQSHGFFDDHDLSTPRWRVQRTRTFEVLEDFGSAQFINHYVVPLLQNAGARIRPVREVDAQTNMVVVDNSQGAPAYVETGSWLSSSANGFTPKAVYSGTLDNPFGYANATRYASGVTGAPTATATYNTPVPESGFYNVYVSYSQGTNRTQNAHWQVHHSGGITDFRLNQRIGGGTWVLLGNFYFEQGASADQAKVVVLNDSGDADLITCDAVRLGGGMGNVARRTNGTSGRPRWMEDACNYLQYTGMLASTLMRNDNTSSDDESLGWSNRPQAAQWEQSRDNQGNNLVYLGWHTNASTWSCSSGVENSGGGRGTGSYRDVDADSTQATKNLTTAVHNAFIDSVRLSYQSSWQNRGIIGSNSYGECNQANLGTGVAGFFFEGLFHDNTADSSAYKDPKLRYAAARGIVQGLISYYGGTVFPPEPITNFRAVNIGNGQVQLSWTPGPVRTSTLKYGSAPTQYRIFKSSNGYGFDNGVDTGNTATQFTANLTPGETAYFRVAGVNSSGISVPSETLAVRVPVAGNGTVLVVNGYQRNDRFIAPLIAASAIGGCTPPTNVFRTFDPRKFQSFDYTVQHAEAIAASSGYGIDSCSKDAINLGNISLNTYSTVFWIGGQQAEADTADGVDDQAFKLAERAAITGFLENGGKLFISGSELAWDFGRSGVTADKQTFLSNNLMASYVADSSNTYNVSGSAGIFAGLGTVSFDNGSGDTYQVRFPDVIAPANGAITCMTYSGGTGGTAAIQYEGIVGQGTSPARVIYLGFGFETITSEAMRNNIMTRAFNYFIPAEVDNWKTY